MITNAVILDHWGIVRADVGIRDGRIVGIGRSGNPDIADGVDPDLIIGPGTDVISGEGKILTAGGFDSHVHFLSPSQIHEALAAGLTTLGGGGTGPVGGLQGDHGHPGRLAPQAGPSGAGRVPGQPAAAGQGQHGVRGGVRGAGTRRGRRLQGARGLGLHPGRGRRRPEGGGGVGAAGRPALGLAQRGRVRGQHHRGDRGPEHLGLPRRGGRRWPRAGHPDHRRAAARAARARPTRPCRTR